MSQLASPEKASADSGDSLEVLVSTPPKKRKREDSKEWCGCGEHWVAKEHHWNQFISYEDCMSCTTKKEIAESYDSRELLDLLLEAHEEIKEKDKTIKALEARNVRAKQGDGMTAEEADAAVALHHEQEADVARGK